MSPRAKGCLWRCVARVRFPSSGNVRNSAEYNSRQYHQVHENLDAEAVLVRWSLLACVPAPEQSCERPPCGSRIAGVGVAVVLAEHPRGAALIPRDRADRSQHRTVTHWPGGPTVLRGRDSSAPSTARSAEVSWVHRQRSPNVGTGATSSCTPNPPGARITRACRSDTVRDERSVQETDDDRGYHRPAAGAGATLRR